MAKTRVTMGRQGKVDDLPYYMEVVKQGWAGTKKKCLQYGLEENEDSCTEQLTGRTISYQHGS